MSLHWRMENGTSNVCTRKNRWKDQTKSMSFARRFIRSWRALANSRVNSSQTSRSSAFFSRNSCNVNFLPSSGSSFAESSSPSSRSNIINNMIEYIFIPLLILIQLLFPSKYLSLSTYSDWVSYKYEMHHIRP